MYQNKNILLPIRALISLSSEMTVHESQRRIITTYVPEISTLMYVQCSHSVIHKVMPWGTSFTPSQSCITPQGIEWRAKRPQSGC